VSSTSKRGAFAVMLVTYANNWSGDDALAAAKTLGYPQGATLWLDVESVTVPVDDRIAKSNAWHVTVRTYYDPGEYEGCQQLLTSQQITQLACDKYWESCSLVDDPRGNPVRPRLGWTMTQVKPGNQHKYGTLVDIDFIQSDARGRLPFWAIAA